MRSQYGTVPGVPAETILQRAVETAGSSRKNIVPFMPLIVTSTALFYLVMYIVLLIMTLYFSGAASLLTAACAQESNPESKEKCSTPEGFDTLMGNFYYYHEAYIRLIFALIVFESINFVVSFFSIFLKRDFSDSDNRRCFRFSFILNSMVSLSTVAYFICLKAILAPELNNQYQALQDAGFPPNPDDIRELDSYVDNYYFYVSFFGLLVTILGNLSMAFTTAQESLCGIIKVSTIDASPFARGVEYLWDAAKQCAGKVQMIGQSDDGAESRSLLTIPDSNVAGTSFSA